MQRDAGILCGLGERARRSEHNWTRNFPLNETVRGGKHTGVFAFGQNNLELASPCYIETTLDRIHLYPRQRR